MTLVTTSDLSTSTSSMMYEIEFIAKSVSVLITAKFWYLPLSEELITGANFTKASTDTFSAVIVILNRRCLSLDTEMLGSISPS